MQRYVHSITQNGNGLDVYVNGERCVEVIENVCANIVRCAVGEDAINYLKKCSPYSNERFCPLSESDFNDFVQFKA